MATYFQEIKNKILDLIKFLISCGKGNDEHKKSKLENEEGRDEEEKGAFEGRARGPTAPGKHRPPPFQTGNYNS
ncbi:hypothetical protein RND71_028628 [Anisodus tanguticus]|uniref:Uncharacterized protein n=1 Tax=Anisodus tanguticus TaxID=243964 RepID=A0AAE1VA77_9SOLA|nr:hypothetical protein RND71_028628 [Anisodus tanguticus]